MCTEHIATKRHACVRVTCFYPTATDILRESTMSPGTCSYSRIDFRIIMPCEFSFCVVCIFRLRCRVGLGAFYVNLILGVFSKMLSSSCLCAAKRSSLCCGTLTSQLRLKYFPFFPLPCVSFPDNSLKLCWDCLSFFQYRLVHGRDPK